jgi:type IV secretion system protein VirB10
MRRGALALVFISAGWLAAQEQPVPAAPSANPPEDSKAAGWRAEKAPSNGEYTVGSGTRIPLSLINSVSTKSAAEGDRVYLETAFPVVVDGKVVIPPGSYVAGTVTFVKRPGRAKGRGELYVRFDSLTLQNGVTRDFRGRIGQLDGRSGDTLDRAEGKIKSEGNKTGDARTVGEAAAAGASVGAIAGSAAGHAGMGAGVGAAAGAAAGLVGVLFTRGPDAILAKGSTIEMVLDRPLQFNESELVNNPSAAPRKTASDGPGPDPKKKNDSLPFPGRRVGRSPL